QRLLVEIVYACSIRAEDDPAAIRRPDWKHVICRVRREPAEYPASRVEHPDVGTAIHASIEHDSVTITGKRRLRKARGHGIANFADLLAGSIEPNELPLGACRTRTIGNRA